METFDRLRRSVKPYHVLLFGAGALVCTLLLFGADVAFAAENGSETIVNAGTGLGGNFDAKLHDLTYATIKAMQIILIIMTAIAGMMIVFGLEDGKKFLWQVMLGAGLAINFGGFLLSDAGIWDMANKTAQVQQIEAYKPVITEDLEGSTPLGTFMNHYTKKVIVPGAQNILPYCLRLLVILTVVQAAWELSLKFMSGDKMQYLLNMTLKLGFFMFLMMNWMDFMQALMEGFELIGLRAAGSDAMASDIYDSFYKPGVQFASLALFGTTDTTGVMGKAQAAVNMFSSPVVTLISLVIVVIVLGCLILAAIEIFMARIEFYTMALMTLPCLAFGTMGKFNFLTEKAIGCMFNCAMKVCVVSFLGTAAFPFVKSFMDQIVEKGGEGAHEIGVLLQAALASLMIFMLIKKIPALMSSLLNGSPQLGGSDMFGTLRSAAATGAAVATAPYRGAAMAAGAVGKVQAARAASQARGGSALRGTLMDLGRNSLMNTRIPQSYRNAVTNFKNTKEDSASNNLNKIRQGIRGEGGSGGGKSSSSSNTFGDFGDKTTK